MTKIISIKTKFGWISASEYKKKIYKIRFGKSKKQNNSKILSVFKKNLTKFLNKKALKINSPYKIEGTKIQKKIWNELRKIKVGETRSYGSIAKKHKISPREVGKICSKNKLLLSIPCHP